MNLSLSAFKRGLVVALLAVGLLGARGVAEAAPEGGALFTVINTNDEGIGSLREAILNANSNGNPDQTDVIQFNIVAGEGVRTIAPLSPLPDITEPVLIDGLTQPGASCESWPPTLLVELDGSSAGDQGSGLRVEVDNSTVRGLVINRFDRDAITLVSSVGSTIQCNFLGTDAAGALAVGNGRGVSVEFGSQNTLIGGTTPQARNLVSGNRVYGIVMDSTAVGNRVEGNWIGTDLTGSAALPNEQNGVFLLGSQVNTIGGTAAGAGNVISGNGMFGISLHEAAHTRIEGNRIGTTADGTAPLGNGSTGVRLLDAENTSLGGAEVGAGNLISANGADGVELAGLGSVSNQVQGNQIGADATGTLALGNGDDGVEVDNGSQNLIGGMEPGAGNQISGNAGDGVTIIGTDATLNRVYGNRIGTDAAGTAPLGNGGAGVAIEGFSNIIGDGSVEGGNTVAFNGANGVQVAGGSGNGVFANAIFANGELGIDLGWDGVTLNDGAMDPDSGPNGLQNFPVLDDLYSEGDAMIVHGALHSTPSTLFRIEFFASDSCDPSAHGEGQRFLGTLELPTTAAGEIFFDVPLPGEVEPGEAVTATATDPVGNTSEFAMCIGQVPTAVTLGTLAAQGGGAELRALAALAVVAAGLAAGVAARRWWGRA